MHSGTFTDSQLPIMAKLSARPGSRPFTKCPLCDCVPEDIEVAQTKLGNSALDLLPRHIASHLKSLAFVSLPWRDDGGGEVTSERLADLSHDASLGMKGKEAGKSSTIADEDIARI